MKSASLAYRIIILLLVALGLVAQYSTADTRLTDAKQQQAAEAMGLQLAVELADVRGQTRNLTPGERQRVPKATSPWASTAISK